MRVFVTGASGFIGSALLPELIGAGHRVVGLARSDRAATAIRALGAEVRRGTLDDLEALADAAREADGVVHLAFENAEQRAGNLAGAVSTDLAAVDALGDALAGTGKPLVGTNATGAYGLAGFVGVLTEEDTLPGGPRIDAENAIIGLAGRDVRSSVVRLPPTVHGQGRYGFASQLVEISRTRGAAVYAGDGGNRWPSAGVLDVARLYRLALESATPGSRLHAVAEEGIALRDIAGAVGRRLGLSTESVGADDADTVFGALAPFVAMDNPTSSTATRQTYGWDPREPGLLTDLERRPDSTV